jgi:hypothetical protein
MRSTASQKRTSQGPLLSILLGMLTGEWRGCGPLPIRIQWTGVTTLELAIFVLADSSRYLQ